MKRGIIAFFSAMLLALTAAKMIWPESTARVREGTRKIIECRSDYLAFMEAMGRAAAGEETREELRAALGLWDKGGVINVMKSEN